MDEMQAAAGGERKPNQLCEVCWTNSWVPVPADDPDAQALKDGSGFVRCDHCWLDGYARSLREQLAAVAELAERWVGRSRSLRASGDGGFLEVDRCHSELDKILGEP